MTTDPLRMEYEELQRRLEDASTPEAREALKQRMIALYRRVDRALGELQALREDLRGLVDRYKQVALADTAVMPRPPEHRASLRQDRLGASTFIEKGWHLITLGDQAGAVQALRRALELAPEDPQAEALLGWAQMLQGEYDAAMGTFGRVLAREPGNALARVNVGFICLKKRIFGEAIEHLSRAIRLDSDRKATLYAHYYLGLVYLEREMYDDAVLFLERAVTLGPNLIEARHALGRGLWFAGRREEARTAWTAGAQSGSPSPWTARCRQLLELVAVGGEVPRHSPD